MEQSAYVYLPNIFSEIYFYRRFENIAILYKQYMRVPAPTITEEDVFIKTRQIIRYRATATLRRPQNKQYSASK